MRAKLGEIYTLQMGKTPARNTAEYWNNGDNDWVSIADLSTYRKYVGKTKETISDVAVKESGIKIVPANTVIMSFKLSIGKTAITVKPTYTNEAIMAFIPTGKYQILPEYAYYLFSGRNWSEGSNKAVMGMTLNKATLQNVEITVPNLDVQKSVIEKLDKLSEVIALREKQLAKLDELVKARFVEMFGDPVANPYGWPTKPLLDMGYCKNGMNFHTGDNGIEIHCLGVGDFKDLSVIDRTDTLPLISLNEQPSEEYLLKDEDIVFVRSNGNKALVGRCLAVYPHDIPTTYSGFCIRYRRTSADVTTQYLLRVLKMESMRKLMAGRGANIQNLNQKILAALNIPIPPMELQNQFAAFVQSIDQTKSTIQSSLDELETLKQSLMQEYFG